ncbi:MAG: hypothetical protein HW380_826 [Magnetococcales bacterium]|nr:hypothetical protein [Magnetococcales bacterium]
MAPRKKQPKAQPLGIGACVLDYTIQSVIGTGGFGITYQAIHNKLGDKVAIKEFFPRSTPSYYAKRLEDGRVMPVPQEGCQDKHLVADDYKEGLKKFLSETKILRSLGSPNIARVQHYFELNETGYIVMDYVEGMSLAKVVKNEGTFSRDRLMDFMKKTLNGLELVHDKGLIHRDLKPDNIYISEDGTPILLDFGSARPSQTKMTMLCSPEWAPIEQMEGAEEGPWGDIYSLACVAYYAITGNQPRSAKRRQEKISRGEEDPFVPLTSLELSNFPSHLLRAIDRALMLDHEERPQTVAAWRLELEMPNAPFSKVYPRPNPEEPKVNIASDLGAGEDETAQSPSPMERLVTPDVGHHEYKHPSPVDSKQKRSEVKPGIPPPAKRLNPRSGEDHLPPLVHRKNQPLSDAKSFFKALDDNIPRLLPEPKQSVPVFKSRISQSVVIKEVDSFPVPVRPARKILLSPPPRVEHEKVTDPSDAIPAGVIPSPPSKRIAAREASGVWEPKKQRLRETATTRMDYHGPGKMNGLNKTPEAIVSARVRKKSET